MTKEIKSKPPIGAKKGIDAKREFNKSKKRIKVTSIRNVKKDFTIIHNATITLLDSEALHIYLYLLSKCMDKEYCYPSRETIVKETGINKNKISNILNYLEEMQLIKTELSKRGSSFNNIYYLFAIQEVSEMIEKDNLLIEKIL